MENRLATRAYALRNIHFPRDRHALELARQRLVFEELLVFQAACSGCGGRSAQKPG